MMLWRQLKIAVSCGGGGDGATVVAEAAEVALKRVHVSGW